MTKFFSGLVVVALLLTPLAITSPAQAVTVKVHREYGQGPVAIPAGVDRVEIVFHGRKGNTVRVGQPCDKATLRGPSGRVERWLRGAWRLPAGGRFSIVLTGCEAEKKTFAQLTKIRLRTLAVDGDAQVLTHGRTGAYEDWANVVVPRHGRVQVRPTSSPADAPWCALHLEGAPRLDIANWHAEYERSPRAIYLEAGSPVANELGEMSPTVEALVPQAGQRVILVPCAKRLRARATKVRPVPATVDGAAVGLAADRRYQEVGVRFTSAGDQWVTAAVAGRLASRSLTPLALTGPDGSTLVGLNTATVGSLDLWYLPEPGRYRLTVRTDPEHETGSITVSSVRELDAEMPADGQPLAFTAQEPGEWVVATGRLDHPPYLLSAQAVGATEWRAVANAVPFVLCRSSFCDQGTGATITPEYPTHYPPLQVAGRYVFLVAFGAGQTGTVSLRLVPAT
jgi:hypothetical protein